MKTLQNFFRISVASVAVCALIFSAGCTKENQGPADTTGPESQQIGQPITDKATQDRIDEVIQTLPAVAVYNETMDEYILLDPRKDNPKFDFASPDAGFSFSGPQGTIEFVQGPDGTFYQVVSPTGSAGMGGGTVTAGPYTLDVNYVLCFNSGDDFFDLGLDVGTFSGFSGAVGIAGDFDALMEGEIDENADPFEYFQGVVAYYAFDGMASGSYPVIDFFNVDGGSADPDGKAIAYLITFQDGGGIFFSNSGELTFSGNSVSFDGTYFGLTDFFFESGEVDPEADYNIVDGFGALTCQ